MRLSHFHITLILFYSICMHVGVCGMFTVGRYDATNTFDDASPQRVNFDQQFSETPVVFALTTQQGGDAAYIRVFDVDSSGFSSLITEPDSFDGPHVGMSDVTYIAVTPGTVILPDGNAIYAGILTTNSAVGGSSSFSSPGSYDPVGFGQNFDAPPTLLTAIQSINNSPNPSANTALSPFLAPAVDNLTNTGFDVALDRLETGTGDPLSGISSEEIGWLAAAEAIGEFEWNGETIRYEFSRFENGIDGWDNNGETLAYQQTFDEAPLSVASLNSRNGENGGFIRESAESTATGITLAVDEDTATDSERSHINEDVSVVSFSAAFTVPEPSTAALSLLSFLSLICVRKRA